MKVTSGHWLMRHGLLAVAAENAPAAFETPLTAILMDDAAAELERDQKYPIRRVIDGVDTVTLRAGDYLDLIKGREAEKEQREQHGRIIEVMRLDGGMRSPVWQDIEVVHYLVQYLLRYPLDSVYRACLEEFGPDRAPSKSAVHRFRQKLRTAYRGVHRISS